MKRDDEKRGEIKKDATNGLVGQHIDVTHSVRYGNVTPAHQLESTSRM